MAIVAVRTAANKVTTSKMTPATPQERSSIEIVLPSACLLRPRHSVRPRMAIHQMTYRRASSWIVLVERCLLSCLERRGRRPCAAARAEPSRDKESSREDDGAADSPHQHVCSLRRCCCRRQQLPSCLGVPQVAAAAIEATELCTAAPRSGTASSTRLTSSIVGSRVDDGAEESRADAAAGGDPGGHEQCGLLCGGCWRRHDGFWLLSCGWRLRCCGLCRWLLLLSGGGGCLLR